MSYTIIFQTKFLKLSDGRIIHLSRQGCNNDTAGRDHGLFTGKVYTTDQLEKYISDFDGSDFELKIGSKWSTGDDYGKHLRRMLKRAVTWDDLKRGAAEKFKHRPYVRYLASVDVRNDVTGEEKSFTANEWEKVCYDFWRAGFKCTYHFDFFYEESEIIEHLNDVPSWDFHIASSR